ncbi:hypothetical protein FB45DRAFT_922041 [Roridomyces roridus]|uniref:Transmembrane protein n=1 Tax=Roridomyces roridus TaxID=1738132 RepID=A0AAD7BMX5_9AGAR|nr:hypothetical protein FB45DRAFT_922041 [Roridomyces roridus]
MRNDERLSTFRADSSVVQFTSGTWTQVDAGASYLSSDSNATVSFSFDGTLIIVSGIVVPSSQQDQAHAHLSYTLDGTEDSTFFFNASSPPGTPLYSSPALSQGLHTLTLRLVATNATLSVSGGNISSTAILDSISPLTTVLPSPELASPIRHRTALIVISSAIGGLVVLAVAFLGLYLLLRRCIRGRYDRASAPYALGPLQVTLPSTKEAFTSPKYSNHGLSFSQSTDSVHTIGLGLPPRPSAPIPPECYSPCPRKKSKGKTRSNLASTSTSDS